MVGCDDQGTFLGNDIRATHFSIFYKIGQNPTRGLFEILAFDNLVEASGNFRKAVDGLPNQG